MVDSLSGIIKTIQKQTISFEVGPIALQVFVPEINGFNLDEKRTLYIYMHWNQEQGPTLYGFKTTVERTVFELIISCSGLGPRIGLAILADLGPSTFINAIQQGEDHVLSKVSGIGTKKAEQMIVQLKHKIKPLLESQELDVDSNVKQWHELFQALSSLHYSRNEIHAAMNHLKKVPVQETSFDQMLRKALAFLSKQA